MLRFFLFLPLEFICQLLYTFYLPLHMLLNLQTSERPCRCSITHSTYLTYLVLLTVLVHTNQLYSQQVWCPGCGLKVCQTKRRRKLTTYSIQERSPKGPNQSHLRSQNAPHTWLSPLALWVFPRHVHLVPVGGYRVPDEPLCTTERCQHLLQHRQAWGVDVSGYNPAHGGLHIYQPSTTTRQQRRGLRR